MIIYDLKINGIREPLGFELPYVTVSWKVRDTASKRSAKASLLVAADADFAHILWKKEGAALISIGEAVEVKLQPRTRYYVRVSVTGDAGDAASAETWFETGKMDEPFEAKWIGQQPEDGFHPEFFRAFTLPEPPVSARLYACGLGLFEAYCNGEKLGEEYLAPYCSDYNEGAQVVAFDLTDELRAGENRLDILCGNGWFKGRLGYDGAKEVYGDRFMALAELRLRFADGSEQVCGTDESWRYVGSDFAASDIYDGECLDRTLWAGKENPEKPAALLPDRKTVDRYSLPVVVKDSLPVRELIHTPAGETVLDFGQNFTGFVEYRAALPAGTTITLDHGEILQNGNFYNDNYRTAKVQMVYVSDGREETVRAHFTYFGFRYVRVTGWPGEVNPADFTGRVLYSDLDTDIRLTSSDDKLNRLAANAYWGQRSNFLDMPTDCPQRDERLGWTGDAQVFSPTACFQMDTRAFYRKYLRDLRLDQRKYGGAIANYLPNFTGWAAGSSVWGDVASFLPMTLYDFYGDLNALRESYPLMRDWLEWIIRQDEEHGVTAQSMKGGTDDFFVASMYYYATATKLARAAQLIGRASDAERYEKLAAEVCAAILHEYFSPAGRLCVDTQTAYLLCLNFDVYVTKERVIEALKRRLQKDCWTIKGGFVGATMMCRVLAENGLEELAAYFLFQRGFPGWMHCVELGATTIWERWNSVLDDGTISGTEMNSLNHYSYGSVMEYVFRDLAGIRSLAPGFTRVRFAPQPTSRLRELTVSYDSVSGVYASHWRINADGTLTLRFTVPFGCTASAVLPGGETVELEAGDFEKTYTPPTDYTLKYSMATRLSELAADPEALALLKEDLPALYERLAGGDPEFGAMTLDELQYFFFYGFNPPAGAGGHKASLCPESFLKRSYAMIDYRANPFFLSDEDIAWVEETLASMTLEEKDGQVFCPLGMGDNEDMLRGLICGLGVGGIMYRPGPKAVVQETHRKIQNMAKIPLLLAANTEAGGSGLSFEGTGFGCPMAVAATDDPENAYRMGYVACAEGAAMGLNWSFAPIVDIDRDFHNPITNTRTFGSDPERVIACASRYLDAGMNAAWPCPSSTSRATAWTSATSTSSRASTPCPARTGWRATAAFTKL